MSTANALPITLAEDRLEADAEQYTIRIVVEPRVELTPDLRDVVRVDPNRIGIKVTPEGPFGETASSDRSLALDEIAALVPVEVARALWGALGRALNAADDLELGVAQTPAADHGDAPLAPWSPS